MLLLPNKTMLRQNGTMLRQNGTVLWQDGRGLLKVEIVVVYEGLEIVLAEVLSGLIGTVG